MSWHIEAETKWSPFPDIFKWIFLNEIIWISIKMSLKFVPRGPIDNIPALVQIMAWRRPGDKPLSEPMMVSSLTHICVTRPQWVNVMQWFEEKRMPFHSMCCRRWLSPVTVDVHQRTGAVMTSLHETLSALRASCEYTGHGWIPAQSDTELCCVLCYGMDKILNKQSSCHWFETPWWCDVTVMNLD